MKKIAFLLMSVLLSLSVYAQKKRELSTPVTMSYLLPKISFQVKVTMECTELIPGPFVAYAEKQFGEVPGITARGQEWHIKSLQVTPVPVADEEGIYQVTTSVDYTPLLFQLTPEGFLAGVGVKKEEEPTGGKWVYTAPSKEDMSINYARFGIQSTQKEVLDSNFTALEVDGVVRQAWDPIVRYELKERADYIQEVTDEIFAIREKRMELLSGKGHVSGEALAELNRVEADYMSLFFGKKISREVVKVVTYIPEKANESFTLFRFSEREGITTRNNVAAQPYIVELQHLFVVKDETPARSGAGITYRVPATANLRLLSGDMLLLEERCVVPQLGYTKVFPLEVISNEGISIEFYPQYGSVKSIVKNR